MPFLRVETGPQAGEIIDLPGETLTIGRERGNDFHLIDEAASRQHLRVICEGERFRFEDLGSANGTFLNGVLSKAGDLSPGDSIRIGATTIQFESESRFERATVVLGPEGDAISVVKSIPGDRIDPLPAAVEEGTRENVERLSRIVSAGRELAGLVDPTGFIDGLWRMFSREVDPDRGYFEFLGNHGEPAERQSRPLGVAAGKKVSLSSAVRDSIFQRREAVLIECRQEDRRFADRLSLAEADVATALAVPILRGQSLLGLVYLDRVGAGAENFTETDLQYVAGVLAELAPRIESSFQTRQRDIEISRLRTQIEGGAGIIGESPAFQQVLHLVDKVAPTDSSILLVGETGSGKEVVARQIHVRSPRVAKPFVALNCAAIPSELLESEFFGHLKGAFTGAHKAKQGKLQSAHGGTLFLDEVGEIPVHLQSKLLRAFEERVFYPVGGDEEVSVDVRIVAATNRDLAEALDDGSFRGDLYYRLSVVTIPLPPLRERPGDIRLLVESFIERLSRSIGKASKPLSSGAWSVLESYAWPGNVRELKNAVERALILSEGGEILPCDFPAQLSSEQASSSLEAKHILTLKEAEELAIRRALEHCGWKKGEAVKLLGTSWPTLNKKINDYGILPPDES